MASYMIELIAHGNPVRELNSGGVPFLLASFKICKNCFKICKIFIEECLMCCFFEKLTYLCVSFNIYS